MNPYLEVAGVSPDGLAALLGVSRHAVVAWSNGQEKVPPSMAAHLAAVLGVREEHLVAPPRQPVDVLEVTPAVWFKFRGDRLTTGDREIVFLARQLGVFLDELERVVGEPELGWSLIFDKIRANNNRDAPPSDQGRSAARLFRSYADLAKGKGGVGDLLRPRLKQIGIPVLESPIKESAIEGCTFLVGPPQNQRPCIFVNSYGTDWYRRNQILMHELAHAIFDLESSGASLDYAADSDVDQRESVPEKRADVFAQECLIPREVLNHVANQEGIQWDELNRRQLAALVAATDVERRLVLKALVDASYITREAAERLQDVEIRSLVKEMSPHALSAREFLKSVSDDLSAPWRGKRNTTIPSRRLRLPVSYVKTVVEAERANAISAGRAAQLLMITEDDYGSRFGTDEDLAAWQ
jgi:Zn-dependent peptidase ImmA (M78 family)